MAKRANPVEAPGTGELSQVTIARSPGREAVYGSPLSDPVILQYGGIGHLLSRVLRQYIDSITARLHEHGYTDIRAVHVRILREIGLGGNSVGAVAARASITKQAASQMIKELVDMGYVRSMIDPANRRSRVILFTERGAHLSLHVRHIVGELHAQMIEILGRDGFERLVGNLVQLASSDFMEPLPDTTAM